MKAKTKKTTSEYRRFRSRAGDIPAQLGLDGLPVKPADSACAINAKPLKAPKRESMPVRSVRSVFNLVTDEAGKKQVIDGGRMLVDADTPPQVPLVTNRPIQ